MDSRRTLTIGVAVAGILAVLVAGYWALYARPPQSKEMLAEASKEPPQLHCVLIRYTGASLETTTLTKATESGSKPD